MIEGLEPYSSMKPSGCPWLGNIPGHWSIRRNGGLFAQRVEYGTPGLPILEVSLKTGVRVRNMDGTGRKQAMSDQGKYRCAQRGDIAYNTMRMWQGAVGVSPTDGLISPAYVVAKPLPGVVSGYYASLFRTPMFMKEVMDCSRGIVMDRNRLYWDQFKQIAVPIFDSSEQAAIVRFLNHANQKIDGFIRSKRKLIGLLNEQKQAIIHRAVTRGLDPNVPLKPSGIPWLGDIPQHWGFISVRAATNLIQTGPFGSQIHQHEYTVGGRPLINPSHIRDGEIFPDPEVSITNKKAAELIRHKLVPDDVVIARRGDLGRSAVVTDSHEGSLCGTGSLLIRLKASELEPRFFQRVFSSPLVVALLSSASIGATMENLNAGMIGRLVFPKPPKAEQATILKAIQRETATVSAAISRTEREIALMQEYRTRLTADVVTGKLDVRAAAASLPAVDDPAPVAANVDSDDLDPDEDADA